MRFFYVAIPTVLSVLYFPLGKCTVLNHTSPCPRFFIYENNTEFEDRWYGAITLVSDYDLNGVYLRIMFDRTVGIGHIKSTFGEVLPRENNEYLFRNREFKLVKNVRHTVRFYVQYTLRETPACLIGFRLNGRRVCPEVDVKGTTTERLFTSWQTDEHEYEHPDGSKTNVLYTGSANTNKTAVAIEADLVVLAENGNASLPKRNDTVLYTSSAKESKTRVPIENDLVLLHAENSTKIVDNRAPNASKNEVESNLSEEQGTLYVSNPIKP